MRRLVVSIIIAICASAVFLSGAFFGSLLQEEPEMVALVAAAPKKGAIECLSMKKLRSKWVVCGRPDGERIAIESKFFVEFKDGRIYFDFSRP